MAGIFMYAHEDLERASLCLWLRWFRSEPMHASASMSPVALSLRNSSMASTRIYYNLAISSNFRLTIGYYKTVGGSGAIEEASATAVALGHNSRMRRA